MRIIIGFILLFTLMLGESEYKFVNFREHLKQACKQYKVSYNDMIKIAYIESTFRIDALNKNRNGTIDVGLFQINTVNHKSCAERGYDVYTLKGNIYCAVYIVAGHKKYKRFDKHWLGRYHSKTPSKKLAYITKLERVKL